MQNHHIQQPLFASASQFQGGDDFDLTEIFADYFSSEFDNDPLGAYTSSMAHHSGAAAVAMAKQQQSQPMLTAATTTLGPFGFLATPQTVQSNGSSQAAGSFLPTGGIKTVFHTGTSAVDATQYQQQQQQQPQGQDGMPQQASKKFKQEHPSILFSATENVANPLIAMQQQQQQQQQPIMSSNEQQQQQQQTMASTMNQQQQFQQQQGGDVGNGGTIRLPVGVGIRLGGVAAQQLAIAKSGGVTLPAGITGNNNNNNNSSSGTALQAGNSGGDNAGVDPLDPEAGMSEQAIAERRQRNREHAKRSRVRKKFMLESLQEELRQLQRTNQGLRMIVQEHIPEHAMQIIADCCTSSPLFQDSDDNDDSGAGAGSGRKGMPLERSDFSLMQSLSTGQQCFVLSDPKLPDNPIVFASPGFYKLTGYQPSEVLGRNCRFLQGPETDARAVEVIRKALATGSDATVCLLNYKADGTPFWNQFFLAALRDAENRIVNYVGVQYEVQSEAGCNSLEDRVNAVLPLPNKDGKSGDSQDGDDDEDDGQK